MKRYEVRMNDGEYVKSFDQLEDAKKYISEHWHDYISRYHIIYDYENNSYILILVKNLLEAWKDKHLLFLLNKTSRCVGRIEFNR